jgi:hypothetical protein
LHGRDSIGGRQARQRLHDKFENAKKIPAINPQPSADTNARTKTKPSMSLKIFLITCLFNRRARMSKPLRPIQKKKLFLDQLVDMRLSRRSESFCEIWQNVLAINVALE